MSLFKKIFVNCISLIIIDLTMAISSTKESSIEQHLSNILNKEEMASLRDNSNIITYRKNDNIFRQNMSSDYVLFVEEGLLKIEKEIRNNSQLIFKILKGPAYVGISSAIGQHTFNYSAYALADTRICFIDKNWFNSTMENNGKFAKHILKINCANEIDSINRLLTLLNKQVPGKMADVLLFFSRNIFQSNEFSIPLSRSEMADYIGISKKSFIRTLSEFKNDKLILVNGKRIKIVREDLLLMLSKIG